MWPKPHFILQLFWSLHTYQGCALDGCETPGQESYTGKTLDNQIVMRTSLGGGNEKCQNILLPTSWGDRKCQNILLPTPILSRCGQRRSLLREQEGLQVENKFRVTSIIIESKLKASSGFCLYQRSSYHTWSLIGHPPTSHQRSS